MGVKKISLLVVKLSVSGLLLFVLYRKTPLSEMLELVAGTNQVLLLPVFAILFLNTVISAVKWRALLQSDQLHIPLRKLVVSYLIGGFFNLFLPSNIGGDSYRIVDTMRRSKEGARSAASVVADRLTGFIALVTLSLVSSMIVASVLQRPAFILLPLFVLLGLVLVLYLLWQRTAVLWLMRLIGLDRFPALMRIIQKFFKAFACYGASRGTVIKVMGLSFLFQMLVVVAVYLMARSLHLVTPFYYFSAFVPLIAMLEAIPISIYGIGIRDAGYVFFFGLAGMGELETRSLALLFLAITVCYASFGGFLYMGRVLAASRKPNPTGNDPPNR